MKTLTSTLVALLTLSLCSSPALASWSAPQRFAVSPNALTADAVDGRGDAVVAWATEDITERGPAFHSSVHVTARTASGRLSTRTVWSSGNTYPRGLSVVLGAGEVTVAWDSVSRTDTTSTTIYAAHGPLTGRWSAPRKIGRALYEPVYPPRPWDQHLAVAADGEVLLAFNGWTARHSQQPLGAAVAWRSPGHSFGAARVLRRGPSGAIPLFDAHGSAYLYGYCNGLVMIAPARSHRFTRTVVLTPGPVLAFSLSVSGSGQGLSSWVAGDCSFDAAAGNTPGPVFASVLRAGTFGKPLALSPSGSQSSYSDAVAVPGGGTVSWNAGGPNGGTFSAQFGADGLPGAAQQIPNGLIPLAADGNGDEVFAAPNPLPAFGTLTAWPSSTPVFVRPAGDGADQPAPASYGQIAAAGPVGSAVALAWNTSPAGSSPVMALSVWRP